MTTNNNIQEILGSDTISQGFREKYNKTIGEIPVAAKDLGNGQIEVYKHNGGKFTFGLASAYTKGETFSKEEVNNLISTINNRGIYSWNINDAANGVIDSGFFVYHNNGLFRSNQDNNLVEPGLDLSDPAYTLLFRGVSDGDVIHKQGDETKDGTLTFLDSPIVPVVAHKDSAVPFKQLNGRFFGAGVSNNANCSEIFEILNISNEGDLNLEIQFEIDPSVDNNNTTAAHIFIKFSIPFYYIGEFTQSQHPSNTWLELPITAFRGITADYQLNVIKVDIMRVWNNSSYKLRVRGVPGAIGSAMYYGMFTWGYVKAWYYDPDKFPVLVPIVQSVSTNYLSVAAVPKIKGVTIGQDNIWDSTGKKFLKQGDLDSRIGDLETGKVNKDPSQVAGRVVVVGADGGLLGEADLTFDQLNNILNVNGNTNSSTEYKLKVRGRAHFDGVGLTLDNPTGGGTTYIELSGGRSAWIGHFNGADLRLSNSDAADRPDTSKSFKIRNRGFQQANWYTTPLTFNELGQPATWKLMNEFNQFVRMPDLQDAAGSYNVIVQNNASKELQVVPKDTLAPRRKVEDLPLINDGNLSALNAYDEYRTSDGLIKYKLPVNTRTFKTAFKASFK